MEMSVPASDIPDLYADGVQVGVGNYGVVFTLLLSNPDEPDKVGRPVGRFRISRDLARTLTTILQDHLARIDAAEEAAAEASAAEAAQ